MTTYNTSDFRKGLKVQIDGVQYLMVEMNFRKPGKGNAIYECTLKNLIRGTTLKRVFRGGDELESADVEEVAAPDVHPGPVALVAAEVVAVLDDLPGVLDPELAQGLVELAGGRDLAGPVARL